MIRAALPAVAFAIAALCLCGCGQKGPLKLPDPPKSSPSTP